jgi:predicted NUDIX family NTP pyrophosphohydrolase
MKTIETLKENKWLSLKIMKYPEKGVHGYVYSHETRCDGKIVSILPYRIKYGKIEYLLRREVTPCWGVDKQVISSITGGVENDDPHTTVIHEILEEAGYDVTKEQLIPLGTSFGIKSSDTVYYYFSVNLTDMKREVAKGDGSELEAQAECVRSKNIDGAVVPLLYTAYYLLQKEL